MLSVVVVAVTLVSGCRPTTPGLGTEPGPQSGQSAGFVSDPNDFYYYEGKPYPLDRSTSEFVVGVANETDGAMLLQGASVPATVGSPIPLRGRRFIVVTVEATAARAGGMDTLIAAMRLRPDVWFVSPIYYQPATRARVLPTDELVAKPKASTPPESLSTLLKEKGLRQMSLVFGTTDQYVLRIESAINADVLRVSRELHDSGLFDWAAPDFIQELRR